MTTQICFTHSIIDWGVPAMVMAPPVDLCQHSPLISAYLSDFLDFAATFPDEGSTLAGRHHNAQGHWGLAGSCAVCH
uniref:Uncharacterized protein n=1 Tax=Echeneis naucrates TaxID=173247 RepID=A0A665TD65_ECHNA